MSLTDVTPPVWRRVLVPGGFTLDRLHRVIQYSMGWQNCHPHCFDVDGVQYGPPDTDDELPLRDGLEARLDQVAGKGSRLRSTYDFGDWWEHELVVEDVAEAADDASYPSCVAGDGGCPPEDVGGPGGYAEFLAALADPTHPRHGSMRVWYGRRYDPAAFDVRRASVLVRRLS